MLVDTARRLHPADCTLLIRLIRRVVELEESHGEDVAVALLEQATSQMALGLAPH